MATWFYVQFMDVTIPYVGCRYEHFFCK